MKKKIVALCLCEALAVVAIGGATLAYFTDTTGDKVNTFTVGNVDIDLTEPSWNEKDSHTLMPGTSYDKDPTITVAENSQDAYVFLKIDLNKYVSLINLAGVDAYKDTLDGRLTGSYPGFGAFMTKLLDDNRLREDFVNRWFTGINHADWKIMNLEEIKAAVAGTADQSNPGHLAIILGYQGGEKGGIVSANTTIKFMTKFGMPNTVTEAMFNGDEAYYIDGVSKSNFNTANAPFKMTFTAYAIQAAEIDSLADAYTALGIK